MTETLFQPPVEAPDWITGGQFEDIEAQAAQLRGYGQEYQQLGRGRFRGNFASYFLDPQISLHFERTNIEIAYAGRSPADRYSLWVLSDDSPEATINGASFSAHDVMVCPPGHEFDGVESAGVEICVVSLAQRPELPLPRAQVGRPVCNPFVARRIWGILCEGVDEFRCHPQILQHRAAVAAFAGALQEPLTLLLPTERADELDAARNLARKLRQFRLARDAIHQQLDRGISVGHLCESLGVSRRSLERVFLSALGVSPARYIRMLQFNRIRKDLLSPEWRTESIGNIAARWGIWHWSRFSHDYFLTFGELPSQTRLTQNG